MTQIAHKYTNEHRRFVYIVEMGNSRVFFFRWILVNQCCLINGVLKRFRMILFLEKKSLVTNKKQPMQGLHIVYENCCVNNFFLNKMGIVKNIVKHLLIIYNWLNNSDHSKNVTFSTIWHQSFMNNYWSENHTHNDENLNWIHSSYL